MVVDFFFGFGGVGVFSTVKQIKGQRVFGLKSLNLDFGGFVSLTRIVGLQAKVVCKNSRLFSLVAARDVSAMKIKVSAARSKERRLFSQATPGCISSLSLITEN